MNLCPLLLTLPLTVSAPPPLPLAPAPAPFLFVKVIPPNGAKVAWQPGLAETARFTEPTPVGLRPGYSYRLELSDLANHRGVVLFPAIEVRGTLHGPHGFDFRKFPVPIRITAEDIDRALHGSLISKVYFLEDPDKADNIATEADVPLEYSALNEESAVKEARERGRIVLILRLGERAYKTAELAVENVAGTVLFPDARALPIPAAPPRVLYCGIPLFDPILGPKIDGYECLHDGGDSKRSLGIDNQGRLLGLDASDTAIEFTTPGGRKVDTSNRVCICVPRFAALRSDLLPIGFDLLRGPEGRHSIEGANRLANRLPPQAIMKADSPLGAQSTIRPSATLGQIGIHALENMLGKPMATAQVRGANVIAEVREPVDITGYPKCQMVLLKWMEPKDPQKIGEELTFFLRYHNGTTAPMTDVVVSDSLTARLEYLDGTAKTDRPATFTVQPNEAGSVTLRWAIDGKLLPGESGLITFKAKIR